MQGEYVMVKFTRRYCAELHQFCAELGHAPKLTVPRGPHLPCGGVPQRKARARRFEGQGNEMDPRVNVQ